MKNLDDVSPTMCLAKWVEGTLYISSGMTHSCHLVPKNKSPIDLILKDSSNLFNTPHKKEERKLMLDGIRQSGCLSCNKIELTKNAISDRMLKNDYHFDHKEKVLAVGYENNLSPIELEIGFDNTCNLKCMYCSPFNSSSWTSETLQYGPYENGHGAIKKYTSEEEKQIYTNAFWDWFPSIYDDLEILRITGGEPFLSKQTMRMLDYIIAHPNPKLSFAINSNLSISHDLLSPYIIKINEMLDKQAIKDFKIFTSMESTESRAEYIRYGLDYNLWKKNLINILENYKNIDIVIMATYNILSVTSFDSLLTFVETLKSKYGKFKICVDTVQMKSPNFQCIDILYDRPELLEYINKTFQKINEGDCYSRFEKMRIARVYQVAKKLPADNLVEKRNMFAKFVDEYDRRKKTDFLSTFPELESFYYDCFKTK